jgi:hypothetical protein
MEQPMARRSNPIMKLAEMEEMLREIEPLHSVLDTSHNQLVIKLLEVRRQMSTLGMTLPDLTKLFKAPRHISK